MKKVLLSLLVLTNYKLNTLHFKNYSKLYTINFQLFLIFAS